MTAIAAIAYEGVVYMGADSASVADRHYLTISQQPKVFNNGPLIIGYTSSFRMGHALQHRLVVPNTLPESYNVEDLDRWMAIDFTDAIRNLMADIGYKDTNNGRETGGVFLCGVKGKLYYFDEDFHANRKAMYSACGSGESACLGALYALSNIKMSPKDKIYTALEAAQSCIATVRSPFNVLEGGKS